MANKSEKERRKQLLNDHRKKNEQEFANNLPMSKENFKKLFDHLDGELNNKGCDDRNILAKTFFGTT